LPSRDLEHLYSSLPPLSSTAYPTAHPIVTSAVVHFSTASLTAINQQATVKSAIIYRLPFSPLSVAIESHTAPTYACMSLPPLSSTGYPTAYPIIVHFSTISDRQIRHCYTMSVSACCFVLPARHVHLIRVSTVRFSTLTTINQQATVKSGIIHFCCCSLLHCFL
jgi:hypothetical protein